MPELSNSKWRSRSIVNSAIMGRSTAPLAKQLGQFYLSLHTDWRWVSRRVETVEMLDLENRQRQVSVDIDVAEVLERAEQLRLQGFPELPIPLGLMAKGLLLDYDVRDASGGSMSVFTSTQDANMAKLAILALAETELPLPTDHDVAQRVERLLFDAALGSPSANSISAYLTDGERIDPESLSVDDEVVSDYWKQIEYRPSLLKLVSSLTANFAPVVWFPLDGSMEIIKYRRIENEPGSPYSLNQEDKAADWRSRFLRPSLPYSLRAANIGYASREHLRIVAPEGTFFGSSLVLPSPPSGVTRVKYRQRLTTKRSLFFSRGQPSGNYYVVGTLYPELHGFFTPAILLTLTTSMLLLSGGAAELLPWRFLETAQEHVEASVALLVLIPSIFVAFIIRDDEHVARRELLRRYRTATLFASVLAIVVAAVSLLIDFGGCWPILGGLWIVLAVAPAALFQALVAERKRLRTIIGRIEEESTMDVARTVRFERV